MHYIFLRLVEGDLQSNMFENITLIIAQSPRPIYARKVPLYRWRAALCGREPVRRLTLQREAIGSSLLTGCVCIYISKIFITAAIGNIKPHSVWGNVSGKCIEEHPARSLR